MIYRIRFSLILICSLCQGIGLAQEIEVCQDCLEEVVENVFRAKKTKLEPFFKDSLRLNLDFKLVKAQKALLFVGDAHEMTIRFKKQLYKAGTYIPNRGLEHEYARYFVPINLDSGLNEIQIDFKQLNNTEYLVRPIVLLGSDIGDVRSIFLIQNENARTINFTCIIVLFLILLYAALQFFFYKKTAYKVYAWYVLGIILFLLIFSDHYLGYNFLFGNRPYLYSIFNVIPQTLVYAIYIEFAIDFLNVRKVDSHLFKVCRVFQALTLSFVLTHSLYAFYAGVDGSVFTRFHVFHLVTAPFVFYMLFRMIFKFKNPIKWFILVGSFLLFNGTFTEIIGASVFDVYQARNFYFLPSNGFLFFNYVEAAYVLETIIFLMGLSYKTWQRDKEYDDYKEDTINQLKEKESLERQVNELLSEKLKNVKEKLSVEKLMTENERNKSQLMQSQLNSLQLQMNPHYLFNSLNSINDFIISKKPEEASEYLALYARMMRNILRNSDKTFSSLEQELQFSEDYLKLESLRFEGRFEYEVIRPRKLEILESKLPGMMLQPILENAVWHGIMPLKRKGRIVLDASQSSTDKVLIIITDNGNGIDKLEQKDLEGSYGLKNIKNKVKLLQKLYEKEISFEISNLENKKGLKVKFTFPKMQ